MSDQFITLQEAATLLDVSSATLRNWDRNQKLKAVRHPINQYRMYRLSDVLSLQRQTSLFPVSDVSEAAPHLPVAITKSLTAAEMRRIVRALHRILRDGEGNSSLIERFDELTKILYCKINDEKGVHSEAGSVFAIRGSDTANTVAARIRKSYENQTKRSSHLFPDRFARINLSDKTIREVVETLSAITLLASGEDLKGLAYEEVIKNTFEKGDNQQFFTPRNVIEFMVLMLEASLSGIICDPACGTSGFLLLTEWHRKNKNIDSIAELLGFEIDDRLAWVAGINLEMHDAGSFKICHLSGAGSLGVGVSEYLGRVDVILTNPPFGSDLTDPEALGSFFLGKARQSRRRGVLFIERCLDLLKPGGVLGIIIDEGVLNSPANADARNLILERAYVLSIVSLPDTTFMPYASVKSSILFLQKKGGRKKRLLKNGNTFFANAEFVGRKPNGEPLVKINKETGKQELHTDLPTILQSWQLGDTTQACEQSFWTPIPNINDESFKSSGCRLDLAYHHPSRHEATRALQDSPYPLKSLSELCDIRNEAVVPSKDLVDEDITYVGLANIEAYTGVCCPVVVPSLSIKSSIKRFEGNDILFSKMRPELRKVCLVQDDVSEGFASSECLVLTPIIDPSNGEPILLRELLSLLLRSDLVYGQIVHQVVGIGRPRLNKAAVMNVRIPVPPIKDQLRLLELHRRSEAASRALAIESEQALLRAEEILTSARKLLLDDLLTKVS